MGDQREWTATVELCPVCHGNNIAGNKYCYGSPDARHEKTRFEFVAVVPARVREERDEARSFARFQSISQAITEAGGLVCEQHPDREFPHDDCVGPGLPRDGAIRMLLADAARYREALEKIAYFSGPVTVARMVDLAQRARAVLAEEAA